MPKTELNNMYKYFTAMMNNSYKRNDMVAHGEYLEKRFKIEVKLNA